MKEWTNVNWEVSDWNGLKELGAQKTVSITNERKWTEEWIEKTYIEKSTQMRVIERKAKKYF